jgi:Dolichyl-phosphate-mannose-protein mannosyltransferase
VWWAVAVAALLAGAFGLRIWGVRHGMPYAYNIDENSHFVPTALALFGHGLNPHYFVNPPLLTYVLHIVLSVWFGGGDGAKSTFASDPAAVWVVARVTVAVGGTAAVGLLYLAGRRLAGRVVGFLAAALLSVAFLPVFYAHLALNDVPTLAPVCLSLWGIAGILRHGRLRDYAIAGLGLGLAASTKYTGGIVIVPLVIAAVIRWRGEGERGPALRGLLLAGAVSVLAFLVGNPYALLDASAFQDGLSHQSDATGGDLGKLGAPDQSGLTYYAWTLTWGLGWVPALAALGGAIFVGIRERRLALLLVPAPVLFLLFMGLQSRFYGRWMLPIYPFLCLLAAIAAMAGVAAIAKRATRTAKPRRWLPATLTVIAALLLCGQGLVYAVHVDRVLSRPDTRAVTRDWMVRHIPPGTKVVIEPVVPDGWARDVGVAVAHNRWVKFPVFRTALKPDGTLGKSHVVGIEDYERTLRPGLIRAYEAGGYCYVIVGSIQRGRSTADPKAVPRARSYYRALDRDATVVFRSSPWANGEAVPFDFDWSFDSYPMAYERPGPVMTVYRLNGGRCATTASAPTRP